MDILEYQNLDLEAFDYRERGDGSAVFRVRVEDSPAGGQPHNEAVESHISAHLSEEIRNLDRLTSMDLQSLGKELANLLFPPPVCRYLENSWNRIEPQNGVGLRIRLKLEDSRLADLPWEYSYLHYPAGPVVLQRRISLVRHEVMAQARSAEGKSAMTDPIQVRIFSANPLGFPRLDLEQEVEEIQKALSNVQRIQVAEYPNTTPQTLQSVLRSQISVFHFAGHGVFIPGPGGTASIYLVDEQKRAVLYEAAKLATKLADRNVRVAVFNACETGQHGDGSPNSRASLNGIAPTLVEAGIPAVVGMQFTVGDRSAILFSTAFYTALAEGAPIDLAVTEGRQAIATCSTPEHERDWGVPVLYLHTSAGAGILFPSSPVHHTETAPGEQSNIGGGRRLAAVFGDSAVFGEEEARINNRSAYEQSAPRLQAPRRNLTISSTGVRHEGGHAPRTPFLSPEKLGEIRQDVDHLKVYVDLFAKTEQLVEKLHGFIEESRETADRWHDDENDNGRQVYALIAALRAHYVLQYQKTETEIASYSKTLKESQASLLKNSQQEKHQQTAVILREAVEDLQMKASTRVERLRRLCNKWDLSDEFEEFKLQVVTEIRHLESLMADICIDLTKFRGLLYEGMKHYVECLAKQVNISRRDHIDEQTGEFNPQFA
jgi:hypothetical protein